VARPAAGAAAKAALLKAGPQLVQATAHLDPFRIQAEKLDAKRQEHQSRKDMESLSLHQTESFIQELDRMKGRVMQIMERAQQLEEESKKTAASAIRA
jgi:predicted nuclease with TOPRIM domain